MLGGRFVGPACVASLRVWGLELLEPSLASGGLASVVGLGTGFPGGL